MGWSVEIPQLPRLRGSELTEIMQRFPPALTVGYATWEQVQANAASPSNVRAMVRAYKECPAPFHALWQEAHGGMCTGSCTSGTTRQAGGAEWGMFGDVKALCPPYQTATSGF